MIRKAEKKDTHTIYNLIHALARFEKREKDASLAEEDLSCWLFEKELAQVQLLCLNDQIIGYALYYPVFASFAAEAHIHLEDMFIMPEYRGKGYGHTFFACIVKMARKEGYKGMEWSCLDWNQQAASFYESLGAKQEHGRLYYHLDQSGIHALASLHTD